MSIILKVQIIIPEKQGEVRRHSNNARNALEYKCQCRPITDDHGEKPGTHYPHLEPGREYQTCEKELGSVEKDNSGEFAWFWKMGRQKTRCLYNSTEWTCRNLEKLIRAV